MVKKILLFAFLVAFVQFSLSRRAEAGTPAPCLKVTTWWTFEQLPPGYFFYANYPGTFVYLIAVHVSGQYKDPLRPWITADTCAPPQAEKETCPTCPSGGKPISLATGNTYIKESDVSLPGLGGGLSLSRTWNSLWPSSQITTSVGLFGPNWRSTYEERIFMGGDNFLKYMRGDGSYWSFGESGAGTLVVVAPANVSATLSQSASSWVLAFQNGERRQFDLTTGLLTAIIDRNGNTTQLSYDSNGRLTTITDAASRHLYFNYPNGSSFLVTSLTSDFGLTLSYSYDAQNRLSQVTKPDLTTVTYTYNGSSQITQVTDSNGKVLESHTYDSAGHGLSSSQANGINALTVTVPQ